VRAALLLFCVTSLHAADLVLSGATVYPSPDAPPIADAVIVIRGGRIARVGPRASIKIATDAQVMDCSGKFVTAGFWNSHVHILSPELLHARDTSAPDLNKQLDAMFNRWGFTTVFDIGSALDNTLALRRRIESNDLRGPRILTVGEPLWTEVPVYVRDYLVANRIQMPIVTTPAEARTRVIALAQQGVNGIKLFPGSLQEGGRVANMPLEMVQAASREAHRRRLPVFAHPQNVAGLEVAIAGGVDILAHTAPQSPPWTPQFVARLLRAHLALIPTLTLFDFEARKGGESDSVREQWIGKMVSELRAFAEAGGEVLFGTDIGYIDHYDTSLEFTLMSRAGMSFKQILASLTTNPTRRFGYSDRTGRIAQGLNADLTILENDPVKDITALSGVHLVIQGGRVTYTGPATPPLAKKERIRTISRPPRFPLDQRVAIQ
jgi:imidazolonepropionase-like amidohydrolase